MAVRGMVGNSCADAACDYAVRSVTVLNIAVVLGLAGLIAIGRFA